MKKHYGFIILAMMLAFSAEAKQIFCRVCGQKAYTEKGDNLPDGWQIYDLNGNHGYVCPGAKCRQSFDKELQAAADRGAAIMSDWTRIDQSEKNLRKKVNTICGRERRQLVALKGQPGKQIAFMRQLVAYCLKNECNATDIWATFAAYADLDAVKYFWPDPANEKVYFASKKQIELYKKMREKRAEKGRGGLPEANLLRNLMSYTSDDVCIADKTGPCALALGRSKKDNSTRFVESGDFVIDVFCAAIMNDRPDVLGYLLKQTGGIDSEFSMAIIREVMRSVVAEKSKRLHVEQALAAAEKAKKVADDRVEAAKIDKRIAGLKKMLGSMKEAVVSRAALALVVKDMTPYDALRCYNSMEEWLKRGYPKDTLTDEPDDLKKIVAETKSPMKETLDNVFSSAPGELGKWFKWRAELKKNWRAGIVDKWIFVFETGSAPGVWVWRRGCLGTETVGGLGHVSSETAFEWERKNGLRSAQYPGCESRWSYSPLELTWVWTPGCEDVTRCGYFAGQNKGTFVWKAGVPDRKRVGIISGAKEGEYVVAPGFQKQKDGKIRWTSGLSHPSYPGIVSAEKMFFWIPDANHLWANSSRPSDESKKMIAMQMYRRGGRRATEEEVEAAARHSEEIAIFKTEKDYEAIDTISLLEPWVKLSGQRTTRDIVRE